MKIIRIKSTGNEYVIPNSKYSELPVFRIVDGFPSNTSFNRDELMWMVNYGSAEIVGDASIHVNIEYKKGMEK